MAPTPDAHRPPFVAGNLDGNSSNPTPSQTFSPIATHAFPSDPSGSTNQTSGQFSSLAEATSNNQPTGSVDHRKARHATESPNYVIWPWEGRDKEAVDRVYQKILSMVKDPSAIYTSDTVRLGVNYWRADLTDDQVLILKSMPEVQKQAKLMLAKKMFLRSILTLNRSVL